MRERLQSLTVAKLKELLRSRGLPVSGRKAVLVDRLVEAADGGAAGGDILAAVGTGIPAKAKPRNTATTAAPTSATTNAITDGHIARDETARIHTDAPSLRIASWNVAGLRGLLKREAGLSTLKELVDTEAVDVLMLQETKLQDFHVPDAEDQLVSVLKGEATDSPHWRSSWACSTARKGYSGVAMLWNDRTLGDLAADASSEPLSVDPGSEAELEGRTLLLSLPLPGTSARLGLVNVYTPNAGAELKRLEYRAGSGGWDERFRAAIDPSNPLMASAGVSHVCVGGDFNVAVEDLDFFNPHEKRMAKQAGTTPEERASMRRCLESGSFVDGFRSVHPQANGQYTYWSQRARNRPRNRGLRLDYFLLSSNLLASSALVDVQHLTHLEGSDHCPIVTTLRLDVL